MTARRTAGRRATAPLPASFAPLRTRRRYHSLVLVKSSRAGASGGRLLGSGAPASRHSLRGHGGLHHVRGALRRRGCIWGRAEPLAGRRARGSNRGRPDPEYRRRRRDGGVRRAGRARGRAVARVPRGALDPCEPQARLGRSRGQIRGSAGRSDRRQCGAGGLRASPGGRRCGAHGPGRHGQCRRAAAGPGRARDSAAQRGGAQAGRGPGRSDLRGRAPDQGARRDRESLPPECSSREPDPFRRLDQPGSDGLYRPRPRA